MNTLFADVALPVPLPQLFTYSIPAQLAPVIVRGSAVVVPFGRKVLTGIVVGFPKEKPGIPIKPISELADLKPMVGEEDMQLAAWISEYYHAPLGETLRLFLPPGFGRTSKRFIALSESFSETLRLSPQQQLVITALRHGAATIPQLQKKTGIRDLYTLIRDLVSAGAVTVNEQPSKKASTKRSWYFSRTIIDTVPEFRGKQQRGTWNAIASLKQKEVEATAFLKEHTTTLATLRSLAEKGLITLYQKEVERRESNVPDADTAKSLAIQMNPAQQACVDSITTAIDVPVQKTFLLHGITGSGKTQVYIESIRRILEHGKTAIVLIPEISLTPQTVRRFQTHFRDTVVWMHSRMSDGERQDAWRSIRAGKYPIVIGPRSALFAPLKNIGLIIVDEEHEASYKQFDASPRYNARDVAIMRSSLHRAVVVLGSATPSIESYANALQGRYSLLTLPERADNAVLPPVTIVNMTDERKRLYAEAKLKAKELGKKAFDNLSRSISVMLEAKIKDRLDKKEGIILLQNRRGFAPFIECTSCGNVEQCDQCNVTMTFHATKKHMRCHYCGKVKPPPTACAKCGGFEFSMSGYGTQRVEQELISLFPGSVIARMDMDSTSQKGSHERILRKFGEGETDILLGTQMVAKGLDFPRVTLVGVISADTQMMLPDFRSAERTFQLLTQVAGRAGRSVLAGEVIIQTSQPSHYALKHVQDHDFAGFYAEEVEFRRSVNYPPFSRIIVLEFKGKNESAVQQLAQDAGKKLFRHLDRESILGPSPAVLSKIKNDFRWQIIIKANKEQDQNGTRARHAAARVVTELQTQSAQSNVKIIVDVDPAGIL